MSLIRLVLRQCAVGALRKTTWAGDRVYDSDNTPLSQALVVNDAPRPYIVVYTDADNRDNIMGTDVANARRGLSLTIEIGVATAVEVENAGRVIRIPATDAGMEAVIDVTERQVVNAMCSPRNPWAQIILSIVNTYDRVATRRGGRAERGTRWAARQVTFMCDTIDDHPIGVPLPDKHPIKRFLTLATADLDQNLNNVAKLVNDVISAEAELPSWEQAQAWLSLTRPQLRGIGIAPLVQEDPLNVVITSDEPGEDLTNVSDQEPPTMTEIHNAEDDFIMTEEPSSLP